MRKWIALYPSAATCVLTAVLAAMASSASAATINVPEGGNLQTAINSAVPGDTILLAPGATYTGNFVLPVTAGGAYITIRSAADDTLLPGPSQRISPAYSSYLPRIQSPNTSPAIRTAAGASYWRLQFLELLWTYKGTYDILTLGDGSSAQNTLSMVPHHLIVDRVYIHGHPLYGQKRAIGLNSANTVIVNSYISDIKATGQDSQAIAGWNGPGPHTIQNNYLEAAGNVVLIGGDDPKIANLTATDLTFRYNTMTRPVSWRDPIVPLPDALRATAGTGGSLVAGTYAYRVAARRDLGSSGTGTSAATAEVSITVGDSGSVSLTWNAVADAKDYVVYGRTPGAQNAYWVTTATSFTDGGAAGTSGTPPSKGTVWTVKNVFELKNARQVQVDHNLMENNWAQAQTGVAVLFTPRNQYGGCTWCVVEDITFEYNVVRHTGASITITGWDNEHPSQQTNSIRIRNNEFSDYSKYWGGSGYFGLLDNQPRDVTVDHNTLISGQGAGMLTLSGPAMSGIVITNNLAKHDSYGIFGTNMGYGNAAIAYYLPDGVVTKNVLAGGRASDYPAGNLFPTVSSFQSHFVDYVGGDFALVPGTDWANAGTDGLDLGADMAQVRATSGTSSATNPPSILTTSLADGVEGTAYSAAVQAQGGTTPYKWTVYSGTLPSGIQLDTLTGALSGVPLTTGDSTFTIQVADASGLTAREPLTLHVSAPIAPVTITTTSLPSATVQVAYSTALTASGGLGTYVWSLTGGALPPGLSLSSVGIIAGTPSTAGSYSVTVRAADGSDASRYDSRTLSLLVAPPANVAPAVTIATPPATVQLASTLTLSASASDSDGSVVRVDFYVDGAWAGSDTTAPYSFGWVATSGQHRFSAVAVDNVNASTQSAEVTTTTRIEIVLHANDVKKVVGRYQLLADATAADGIALLNPDAGVKFAGALAAPGSYAEFQFYAEAGRGYHLWIRGRAEGNSTSNDSMYVQLSNVTSAAIGTTKALGWELEDGSKAGVMNWGWQDDGIAPKAGKTGITIVFATSGLQTIRLQPREDGLRIDQIVISPDKYLLTSPGALKNDGTVVAK